MRYVPSEVIDNRLIATASGPQTITVGNTSSTPTVDIPVLGHDVQTGIEIDDASGIVITAIVAYPLGLRVDLDITSAVVGSYPIVLISGGRDSSEIAGATIAYIDITGIAGGVSYSNPFDITAVPVSSVTLAGDVTGASGANTVTKIQGTPVSATPPTSGQVLQISGGIYVPTTLVPATSRQVKKVTHADFSTVVAGPGGQYALDWSNVSYDAYDLAIDVSGSGDATGTYRIVLPNLTTAANGYSSTRSCFMVGKLSGQTVSMRTFNGTNDTYVRGYNTVSGSRPTSHMHTPGDYVMAVMQKESASNIYINIIHRELQSCRNSRTSNISSVTYGNPAGTAYVWGAGNFVDDGESSYAIDVSNQNFSCLGFNRKVEVDWRIYYAAGANTPWTLDGWLHHSVSGEISGSRFTLSMDDSLGQSVPLIGNCEFDWDQPTNGTVTLYLYRTGTTGNFTSGYISIKEVD